MDEAVDILELKFHGNNISPESVKPSEVANIIAAFERLLLQQAKADEPGIDVDEVLFCFEKIENNSLDLLFKPVKVKEIIVGSYLLLATAVSTGDYTNVSKGAIQPLKEIVKFTKKHNCLGQFNHNYKTISNFTKDLEINYAIPNSISGETTIYGKIIRIGGEEPRLHFRINEDEKLIFDINEKLAKELAHQLYEYIGLVGVATWDATNFNIENFEILKIVRLDNQPLNIAFDEIKGVIGKYWDEVEDVENYLN
ncbi:hypothetical protein [Hydrobacter penzbergensis]|nr:hypothetical protein [Hydrobacter penzbergensis]